MAYWRDKLQIFPEGLKDELPEVDYEAVVSHVLESLEALIPTIAYDARYRNLPTMPDNFQWVIDSFVGINPWGEDDYNNAVEELYNWGDQYRYWIE